jgi:hypothetical protein
MKKTAMLLLGFFCYASVFANDSGDKTFLVLFKSKELKDKNISLKEIESQFSGFFKTKSYSGNSELALFIDIPSCDFDTCFLGEFLVELGNKEKSQLQSIAFRLFDLTENKKLHQSYLAQYEESIQKKKTPKPTKAASNP